MSKPAYFVFIKKCGELLGRTIEEQASMVPDPNWYGCFDDGMTPEEAVEEFRQAEKREENEISTGSKASPDQK